MICSAKSNVEPGALVIDSLVSPGTEAPSVPEHPLAQAAVSATASAQSADCVIAMSAVHRNDDATRLLCGFSPPDADFGEPAGDACTVGSRVCTTRAVKALCKSDGHPRARRA